LEAAGARITVNAKDRPAGLLDALAARHAGVTADLRRARTRARIPAWAWIPAGVRVPTWIGVARADRVPPGAGAQREQHQ
jgi:hypothetical protein